jgi:signal peptide peptidase SppA
MFNLPKYWAGTPESLQAYIDAVAKLMESDMPTKRADYLDMQQDAADLPRLLEMQGDVAVISIRGPLTNSDSWMNMFTGAVSYSDIRAALIFAVNSEQVKAIALDIQSGGGAVSGLADTADLIKTIDTKVKPVYAYGDSLIASAAYRLGISARSLSIGRETEAGSIGVVMVHKEMSKMMEKDGITATVIRSGKWKMLGNPYEALSEVAQETLQAQVDQLNGLFVDYVAECRGKSAANVEATIGGGRIFIGQSAVDVGMVDAVTNFDSFMSGITQGIAISEKRPQYGAILTKGASVATALTDQQIADAAALRAAAVPVVATPVVPEAATEQAQAPAVSQDVVALLQGQLATAQSQVLALSIEAQALKTSNAALEAQSEKLRPAVRAAVSNLRVAMGGSATGVEALNDDSLMAEHASLAAQFTSKFPAGGVAAVSSTASAEKASDEQDFLRMARLKATRLS